MSETGELQLSIVIPALNEQDNVAPLLDEIKQAVLNAGINAEVIIVDDGSTDGTLVKLTELGSQYPWLRVLHRDKPQGQSAAMHAGIAHARAPLLAMLDADLQNDPADIPKLYQPVADGEADLAQGDRSAKRTEGLKRKFTSRVGKLFRLWVLGDRVVDTGCTLRVLRTDIARQYPLHFKGMHRYLPVYARMLGARIMEVPVNHRPRLHGQAKYGMLDRALVGLYDIISVRWMLKRYRNPHVEEINLDRS